MNSREQFRDVLKTHLFTQAYAFLWELLFNSVYDIDIDTVSYALQNNTVFRHAQNRGLK